MGILKQKQTTYDFLKITLENFNATKMNCQGVKAFIKPMRHNLNLRIQCQNLSLNSKDKLKTLKEAYASEGKYQSPSELARHLSNNVLYYEPKKDKSGVIIVNKPAGVPLKADKDGFIGLSEAMPELASIFGLQNISVVKSVQRFASGCVLLAGQEEGINRLKNCLNRSTNYNILDETFYAITNGLPRKKSTDEVADLRMEKIRKIGMFQDSVFNLKSCLPHLTDELRCSGLNHLLPAKIVLLFIVQICSVQFLVINSMATEQKWFWVKWSRLVHKCHLILMPQHNHCRNSFLSPLDFQVLKNI